MDSISLEQFTKDIKRAEYFDDIFYLVQNKHREYYCGIYGWDLSPVLAERFDYKSCAEEVAKHHIDCKVRRATICVFMDEEETEG